MGVQTEAVNSSGSRPAGHRRRSGRRPRPFGGPARIAALLIGSLLVLLGLAGLVLPGLQGLLTLVLGAAVLSLVSDPVHRTMRRGFRIWPRGWRHVLRFQRRLRRWLGRPAGRPSAAEPEA